MANAGGIAIVAYDSDAPDSFTFVVLRDIEAGTIINFTDNGWLTSGGLRSGEGTVVYAAVDTITAGSVTTLTGLDLDDAGDQIIAYVGDAANPTVLYAIDFADGDNAFADDARSAATSALPAGLDLGLTAVATGFDNAAYFGPGNGTQPELLATIGDPANWTGGDFLRNFLGTFVGVDRPEIDLDFDNSTHGGRDYRTSFALGGFPVKISDVDILISDRDGSDLDSATIKVNGADPGDLLSVNGTLPAGITTSGYDPGTGILELSGSASHTVYETAIRLVEFSTTASTARPGTSKRVEVTVFDGDRSSPEGKAFINISAGTAAPVLDLDANNSNAGGSDYTATFSQSGPAIPIADIDASITDADSAMLASATIVVGTNRQPDDLLSISGTLPAGISASTYNPSTGVLALIGAATLANYQAALRQVVFSNSSSTPFTGDRVLDVTVSDGSANSNAARTFMHVVAVTNIPPALNLDADGSTTAGVDYLTNFIEGGSPVAIVDADVSIIDSDSPMLASATIRLTNPQAGDILAFNGPPPGGIVASTYDPMTGVLTLAGSASSASYQAALLQITFNTGANPASDTRIIEVLVNDGIATSNSANAIVQVVEINDSAPVLNLDLDDSTAPGTSYRNTFTENGAPVPIADVDTTIVDLDSTALASATITLTNPETGDLLVVAGTLPAGISASGYDPVSGILTLAGTASLADYQSALTQVRFSTAGDDPAADQRVLEVVVNDALNDSNAATALLAVSTLNDAPDITVETPATYVENAASVVLSPLATVTDPDDPELTFASVSIEAGSFPGDGDVLTVNGATSGIVGGVAFDWNTASKSLVFNGVAPLATYQALLRQVEFHSNSDDPTNFNENPSRSLVWSISEARTPDSTTTTIDIIADNDAPEMAAAATAAYTEGDSPITISPTATVRDVDSLNLTNGQVTIIEGKQPGDILTVNGLQNGTFAGVDFSYDDTTSTLSFHLTAPVENYQTLLEAVQFQSTSQNPTNFGANPTRTLAWGVVDGIDASNIETTTLIITEVNDPPVNTRPGSQIVNEEDVLAIAGVSVADVDSGNLTTQLKVLRGTLTVAAAGTVAGNGTATVVVSGTIGEVNAALAGLAYQGNPDFNGFDTLQISTSDGALSDRDLLLIAVDPVNDAPTVADPDVFLPPIDEDTTAPPGQTVASIAGPAFADIDAGAVLGGVAITSNAATAAEGAWEYSLDMISWTVVPSVSETSALILASSASLRFVPAANFVGSPGVLTAHLIDDLNGALVANGQLLDISGMTGGAYAISADAFSIGQQILPVNDAPVLDLDADDSSGQTPSSYSATFTEGGAPVAIADADARITDIDSATIEMAAIVIVGATTGDALSVTGPLPPGITATPVSPTSIALTGSATHADYGAALGQIVFSNSSDTPSLLDRTIRVTVTDGQASSDATTLVSIAPTDDPPVNTVPGAQTVAEDTALAISGIQVADPDSASVTTTLTVTNGTLLVPGGIAAVTGGGSTSVVVSGTLAEVNAALAAITYQGASNFNGTDQLTVSTSDGTLTDQDQIAITVTPVNNEPLIDLDADNSSAAPGSGYFASYTEDSAAAPIADIDVSITDPDDTDLEGATIRLFNGMPGDLLGVNGPLPAGITTAGFDSGTGELALAGTATLAAYQAALRQIEYSNTTDTPNEIDRLVIVTVTDGQATSSAVTLIDVTAVNGPPTVDFPIVSFIDAGASASDGVTNSGAVVFTGTVTDDDAGLQVEVFSGATSLGRTTLDGSAGTWTVSATLPDGVYGPFTAIVTDSDGATASAQNGATITVDTVAPDASIRRIALDPALPADVVSGRAEPASTISLFVDGAPAGTATTDGAGRWGATIAVPAVGTHNLTATATDLAGNTVAPTPSFDVEVFPSVRSDYFVQTVSEAGGLRTQADGLRTRVTDAVGATPPADLTGREALQFADWAFMLAGADLNRILNIDGARFDDVLFRYQDTGAVIYTPIRDESVSRFGVVTTDYSGFLIVPSVDIDNDGHADVFAQDSLTGSIFAVIGSESGASEWTIVSNHLTPDWVLTGSADLNLDGNADAIVRQQSTGTLVYADMAGGAFAGWQPLTSLPADMDPAVPGPGPGSEARAVGGSGDVDADGDANGFVQEPSDGSVYVAHPFETGGSALSVVSEFLTPDWKLSGAGDLNGDGFVDSVLQQQSTGDIVYAAIVGGAFTGWHWVTYALTPDWRVGGVGDVDGDGFADVVVQDAGGEIVYAAMANGAFTGWHTVATTPGWLVAAVADLNGDGNADVVVKTTSAVPEYQEVLFADMRDGVFNGWGLAATGLNPDWLINGVGDFDNDGFNDLLVQQQSTGTTRYAATGPGGFDHWSAVQDSLGTTWHLI